MTRQVGFAFCTALMVLAACAENVLPGVDQQTQALSACVNYDGACGTSQSICCSPLACDNKAGNLCCNACSDSVPAAHRCNFGSNAGQCLAVGAPDQGNIANCCTGQATAGICSSGPQGCCNATTEPCTTPSQCVAGVCLLPTGAPGCLSNGDCISNNCGNGRCYAPGAPPPFVFVLYGERSLNIGAGSSVQGDIGVRTPLAPVPPAGPGWQLVTNHNVTVTGTVVAPYVSLGANSNVGAIETYAAPQLGAGVIHKAIAAFPATMPDLPLAFATPGTMPVNVAAGVTILPPGNYAALTMAANTGLSLAAGTYNFASVSMANGSSIVLTSGPVVMNVAGSFTAGTGVAINFNDGQAASGLEILIQGSDGPAPAIAATIGNNSNVTALIAAPHGTLSLGGGGSATGAFHAFDLVVAPSAVVAFQNGFLDPLPNQWGSQQLHGYYGQNPNPAVAPLVGPVPPNTQVKLSIELPLQNRAALVTLENAISDPTSSSFRQYLTHAQLAATYFPTNAAYQSVENWAGPLGNGFMVTKTYSTNMILDVTATASQVQQALFANLVYRQRADGSSFITVDREPSVNLSTPLLYINGLDLTFLPTPSGGSGPNSGPSGGYFGWDWRNAYLGLGPACSGLTGAGQTIGLLELTGFANSDVTTYISSAFPATTSPPSPAPPSAVPVLTGGTTFGGGPQGPTEVVLDIDAVLSMAPAATVTVFEADFFSVDSALAGMVAVSPPLSVVSSSWTYPWTPGQEDDVLVMSLQGTTMLIASGDTFSGGDPQDNRDYQFQTLVGGTVLTTANLTTPPLTYPSNYYTSEATWVQSNPPAGTKGGIMNGASCPILGWPFPGCGPGARTIPSYQVGVDMSANGGSTAFRNFPDVAMAASGSDIVLNGAVISNVAGTSLAAPLWAGFVALAGQLAAQNNAFPLGFINPVIYDIGKTRGQAASNDLYSVSFHDIADMVNAGAGGSGGFVSVAGYDLNTGWGTPTCTLLQALAGNHPTSPVGYSLMEVHITNGDDGINDGNNETATLSVFTAASGASPAFPPFVLRASNGTGWSPPGATHDVVFTLPTALQPTDITSVSITLTQPSCSLSCDNWSIAGLDIRLFNPTLHKMCALHADGSGLQNGLITESNPTVSIAAGGCPAVSATLPANPVNQLVFTLGTGQYWTPGGWSGQLPAGSEVDLSIFPRSAGPVTCPGLTNTPMETGVLIPPDGGGFDRVSQNTIVYQLSEGSVNLDQFGTVCVLPVGVPAQTTWQLYGLNVMAEFSDAAGTTSLMTCLADLTGGSNLLATQLSGVVEFNSWLTTGCQ